MVWATLLLDFRFTIHVALLNFLKKTCGYYFTILLQVLCERDSAGCIYIMIHMFLCRLPLIVCWRLMRTSHLTSGGRLGTQNLHSKSTQIFWQSPPRPFIRMMLKGLRLEDLLRGLKCFGRTLWYRVNWSWMLSIFVFRTALLVSGYV